MTLNSLPELTFISKKRIVSVKSSLRRSYCSGLSSSLTSSSLAFSKCLIIFSISSLVALYKRKSQIEIVEYIHTYSEREHIQKDNMQQESECCQHKIYIHTDKKATYCGKTDFQPLEQ